MSFFNLISENNLSDVIDSIISDNSLDCREYIESIGESLLSLDAEYALAYDLGCLLVRIYDGGYSFAYPIALTDDADPLSAVGVINAYCVKEEIPLVLCDVPAEELGGLIPLFRHMNVDAEDKAGECYTVRVLTEAAMINEIPTLSLDRITLDAILPEDDAEYAALCKDAETNKFWGYDYSIDVSDPSDSYFRLEAESEFSRGVSISFAIRAEGAFVGEALLYAFNGTGGCEVAIRIKKEYRGRGIAGITLDILKEYAADIGITRLSSRVMTDNEPSRMLCLSHLDFREQIDEKTIMYYSDL